LVGLTLVYYGGSATPSVAHAVIWFAKSIAAALALAAVPETLAALEAHCCACAGCASCGPSIPPNPAAIAAMIATYMILFIRTINNIMYIYTFSS
jgi:hypothetical protein